MKKTAMALLGVVLAAVACGGGEAGEVGTMATSSTAEALDPSPPEQDLLDVVIARGELSCGVNEILPGFGYKDSEGIFTGFDVDLCRAVAAAILGEAQAVSYQSLNSATRFEAVHSGLIDLLSRNTTRTQNRDTALGLDFGPTTYYDGQQLMAKASAGFHGASTLEEIEGAVVCANAGTTTEKKTSPKPPRRWE